MQTVTLFITLTNGECSQHTIEKHLFDLLEEDFGKYCIDGSPTGGVYTSEEGNSLFLNFASLLLISTQDGQGQSSELNHGASFDPHGSTATTKPLILIVLNNVDLALQLKSIIQDFIPDALVEIAYSKSEAETKGRRRNVAITIAHYHASLNGCEVISILKKTNPTMYGALVSPTGRIYAEKEPTFNDTDILLEMPFSLATIQEILDQGMARYSAIGNV